MTPAERQKAYRERLAEERHGGKPSDLSRVTLMRQLNDCFDQIDRRGTKLGDLKADIDEGAQYLAEQILAELVTRYDLDVHSIKRKAGARVGASRQSRERRCRDRDQTTST